MEMPIPSCQTGSQTSDARNHDSCEVDDGMVNYDDWK